MKAGRRESTYDAWMLEKQRDCPAYASTRDVEDRQNVSATGEEEVGSQVMWNRDDDSDWGRCLVFPPRVPRAMGTGTGPQTL